MKVLNIEEMMKTDGSPYWEVTIPKKDGTPSGSPLVEWEKPTYQIGDELPFQVELVKREGKRWYYKRKATSQSVPSEGYYKKKESIKYTKDTDDIMLQVAFKGAVELEGYWYVPDGKVHTDRVLENTALLNAGLHLLRPKKEV